MNGKDLLQGMSHVDEQYVDEAENRTLRKIKSIIRIRKWALVACVVILIFGFVVNGALNPRLSKQEIEALREQYPIYEYWNNPNLLAYYILVTLEEHIENGGIENFVYVEVAENSETFYMHRVKDTITTNKDETNLQWWDEFFEYTVTVISDTEGIFKEGDQFKLVSNSNFDCVLPDLSEGMRMVIPVKEWDIKEDAYGWGSLGCYYVTEEGYVISAYDEEYLTENVDFNGIKVDKLIKKLSKLMDEHKQQ